MKISIDTKEDSHDDLKKVIKMLQNLVGDSQEIFTNQPEAIQEMSPIANIFGDTSALSESSSTIPETTQEAQKEQTSESTEDLFAELFSEDELKKMDTAKAKEEEEDEEEKEIKSKSKKYNVEFY